MREDHLLEVKTIEIHAPPNFFKIFISPVGRVILIDDGPTVSMLIIISFILAVVLFKDCAKSKERAIHN